MNKILKAFTSLGVALVTFAGAITLPFTLKETKANTTETYENPVTINISDIAGNSFIRENGNWSNLSYNVPANTNSRVFKFKILTKTLSDNYEANLQINSSSCNLWLRNDGWFFAYGLNGSPTDRYYIGGMNEMSIENNSSYDIEIGRLRVASGDYSGKDLIYLKVNGEYLKNGSNESHFYCDPTAENGAPFSSNEDKLSYKLVNIDLQDANYVAPTYETPDEISITDLKISGKSVGETLTLDAHKTMSYESSSEHNSVILTFDYEVKGTQPDCQFHFNDTWIPDDKGGVIWFQGVTVIRKDNLVGYVQTNGIGGGKHRVEIGNLYISGGSDAGNYYVYIKVNGALLCEWIGAMPGKASLFTSGTNGDVLHNYKVEGESFNTPLTINIMDISSGNTTIAENKAWENYNYSAPSDVNSRVFKFTVVTKTLTDSQECNIQINSSSCNLWIKKDNGKTTFFFAYGLDGAPTDKYYLDGNGDEALLNNSSYEVEIGRLRVATGENKGKDFIYLKVNGNYLKNGTTESCYYCNPNAANGSPFSANANVFSVKLVDIELQDSSYEAPSYEKADRISVSDLKIGGVSVGSSLTLSAQTTTSYGAKAAHKSVIFEFDYDVKGTQPDCQFHFNDGFIADEKGGVIWLQGVSVIRKDNSEGYVQTSGIGGGKHRIEAGSLYINSGYGAGKYYVYVKCDGALLADYVCDMPGKANVFFTGTNGDAIYDINYQATTIEGPDIISVSDLKLDGYNFGNKIVLDNHKKFSYDARSISNSVIFKFIYDVKGTNPDSQFHFYDGWIPDSHGGLIWLQSKTYIRKDNNNGYVEGASITRGMHLIELGSIYQDSGVNAGKYRVYAMCDGVLLAECYCNIPMKANLFTTGTNGDAIYDINCVPTDVSSSLYVYKWNPGKSGIMFSASFSNDLVSRKNISECGFIIVPKDKYDGELIEGSSDIVKIPCTPVINGNTCTIKGAIAGIEDEHIARNYVAKVYFVMENGFDDSKTITFNSDAVTTSFYDEINKASGLSTSEKSIFDAIKDKVLCVTIDEATGAVNGATKTGDFTSSTMTLTGPKSSYGSYIVNGLPVFEGDTIQIGYYFYSVSIDVNKITLTKVTKKIMYGGSEHFVALNSGHDPLMNEDTLSPMLVDMGMKTVRFDIYLSSLWSVGANDTLILNEDYYAKIKGIINTLTEKGGATDFLAVFWVIEPSTNTYVGGNGLPWASNSAPNPATEPDYYLNWLQINGKAAKATAELFPEITSYEAWNEPEMHEPMSRRDGGDFTTAEKARILTDLMYYYSEGVKAANPHNKLTTSSLCCNTTTDARFAVKSVEFLEAFYKAIKDDVAVPGKDLDKDPNNYFDVINVHPYLILGVTASNWTNFMNSLHAVAEKYGDYGTEIWITEFGFAQNRTSNCIANMKSVLQQAEKLEYLTKFYFYKVHDYGNTKGTLDDDKWGLYNYDGSIKEIGTVVKEIINPEN